MATSRPPTKRRWRPSAGCSASAPPPSPPPVRASVAGTTAPTGSGRSAKGAAASSQPASVKACAAKEPGCVETDRANAKSVKSSLMVGWSYPSGKSASTAAAELVKALKRQGGRDIVVKQLAGDVSRVSARFKGGSAANQLLGAAINDDAEFLLAAHAVAFRASSSSDGFPFSTAEAAAARNRERLLKVRSQLFGSKYGWSCSCPTDADPISAAKCALLCEV